MYLHWDACITFITPLFFCILHVLCRCLNFSISSHSDIYILIRFEKRISFGDITYYSYLHNMFNVKVLIVVQLSVKHHDYPSIRILFYLTVPFILTKTENFIQIICKSLVYVKLKIIFYCRKTFLEVNILGFIEHYWRALSLKYN